MKNRHTYTEEQHKFIKENYKDTTTRVLVERFNKRFNANIGYIQMKRYKSYYGFKNGLDNSGLTDEQKEWIEDHYKNISNKELTELFNETFNTNYKEQKFVDYRSRKGLKNEYKYNSRHREEFTEKVYKNGQTVIKVNGKFIPKHRYLYEKHIGKIPNGYAVIFKDNNKNNFDLSNLVLVHSQVFNTIKTDMTDNVDINESVLLLGELRYKLLKIERLIK